MELKHTIMAGLFLDITLYANISRFNYNHEKTSPAVSISTYKFYMRTVR